MEAKDIMPFGKPKISGICMVGRTGDGFLITFCPFCGERIERAETAGEVTLN